MTILTPEAASLPAGAPLRRLLCAQLHNLAGRVEAGLKVVVSASDVLVRLTGAVAVSDHQIFSNILYI